MMFVVGLGSDPEAVRAVGERLDARVWTAHPTQPDELPYRAMFEAATDEIDVAAAVADVGLYIVYRRVIKQLVVAHDELPERAIASFAMVRSDECTHQQADRHWRDVHGPLALECHSAMTDYEQLSVVTTLSGTELDGVALCAFADRETLSTRFFDDDTARQRVFDDVATFADPKASLPRVVLSQIR